MLPQSTPPEDRSQPEGPEQTELGLHPSASGPAGTVPVVRFDVEKYLASIKVLPEDPRHVLRKMPPPETRQAVRGGLPAPAPETNNRYYVAWLRYGTNYGSGGAINLWDTAGPVNNETSIAPVAISRGTPLQTVEVGKIELQSLNGDLKPHFFTYYMTNGYASSGDGVGGYNALFDGWVQYSSIAAPGMELPGSLYGGVQSEIDIKVILSEGNWWVKAGQEWAGYYPSSLFAASGLRDEAAWCSYFAQ
jgi:hypothetical protein